MLCSEYFLDLTEEQIKNMLYIKLIHLGFRMVAEQVSREHKKKQEKNSNISRPDEIIFGHKHRHKRDVKWEALGRNKKLLPNRHTVIQMCPLTYNRKDCHQRPKRCMNHDFCGCLCRTKSVDYMFYSLTILISVKFGNMESYFFVCLSSC